MVEATTTYVSKDGNRMVETWMKEKYDLVINFFSLLYSREHISTTAGFGLVPNDMCTKLTSVLSIAANLNKSNCSALLNSLER